MVCVVIPNDIYHLSHFQLSLFNILTPISLNSLIYHFIIFYYFSPFVILTLVKLQFSHSVMSYALWSHGPLHARLPYPSPTPGAYVHRMPSNHLILCWPLLLLPSICPTFRVFSNESVLCIRWPKYWHFSFSISPSNEYSGLISFRIDWLPLLAVQGTLSLLQHKSS